MFTLRLFVMGLVAIVPSDNGNDLMLVVPETCKLGENPRQCAPFDPWDKDRHYPILICDTKDSDCRVKAGADQWSAIASDLGLDPQGSGLGFTLHGEHLTVLHAEPGFVDLPRDRFQARWHHKVIGSVPRAFTSAADAQWVPSIEALNRESALIDERHLIRPETTEIAALLSFHGVESSALNYNYPPIGNAERAWVRSLTFRHSGLLGPLTAVRHAAPDVFLVEVIVPGPYVELMLKPFDQATSTVRKLRVKPLDGHATVDVLLGNLTRLQQGNPHDVRVGSKVSHFEVYHRLSEEPPLSRPKLPRIGYRKVDACDVTRPRPSVIDLVSKWGRGAGGADRPVCTTAEFSEPVGALSLASATTLAMRRRGEDLAVRRPGDAAASVECDLLRALGWVEEESPSYTSEGRERQFRNACDAVVLVWRELPGQRTALGELLESLGPILDVRSGEDRYVASSLGKLFAARPSSDEIKEIVNRAAAKALPVFVDDKKVRRYFFPDRLRIWYRGTGALERIRGGLPGATGPGTENEGYLTFRPRARAGLFEELRRVSDVLAPLAAGGRFEYLVEPAEMGLARVPATFAPDTADCPEWGTQKVEAPRAHRRGARGQGVVVAIVDSGMDLDHPSLRNQALRDKDKEEDWDFADPGGLDTEDQNGLIPEDTDGHGTHVAGIVADVAPESELMPLRVDLSAGEDAQFVAAIQEVARKAWNDPVRKYVLNLSWTFVSDLPQLRKAIEDAIASGVVVVAAVGNSPHDLAERGEYPAGYPEDGTYPDVISVAATYRDDARTCESNYGRVVDLSAPGWAIRSAWLDGATRCANGSSAAAAYVSGAAALLRSKDSGLVPPNVAAALAGSSDPIDQLNRPRFCGMLGQGRVNAANAIGCRVQQPLEAPEQRCLRQGRASAYVAH